MVELIPFALIALAAIVPGLVWLKLFLHEDYRHPEPRRTIVYTFFAGMLSAGALIALQNTVPYALFHGSVLDLLLNGRAPFDQFGAFLTFAGIEEMIKFGAVFLLVRFRKEFREPLDAMICMIIAALGFAIMENIMYASFLLFGYVTDANIFQSLMLRSVGATLLHALSSAVVGYYWALALFRRHPPKKLLIQGLTTAIFLHAIFNYLILIAGGQFVTPLIFLSLIFFFVLIDFQTIKRKEHMI